MALCFGHVSFPSYLNTRLCKLIKHPFPLSTGTLYQKLHFSICLLTPQEQLLGCDVSVVAMFASFSISGGGNLAPL